jgi:hypothetical protein
VLFQETELAILAKRQSGGALNTGSTAGGASTRLRVAFDQTRTNLSTCVSAAAGGALGELLPDQFIFSYTIAACYHFRVRFRLSASSPGAMVGKTSNRFLVTRHA